MPTAAKIIVVFMLMLHAANGSEALFMEKFKSLSSALQPSSYRCAGSGEFAMAEAAPFKDQRRVSVRGKWSNSKWAILNFALFYEFL